MSLYTGHESATKTTVLGAPDNSGPRSIDASTEALQCLREAAVPFALMHADPSRLRAQPRLEVLVDPGERTIAVAALRRAGYREMHRDNELRDAWTFLRYDGERFHTVALFEEFVYQGIRYMDAALALGRRDGSGPNPCLALEDRVLHVAQRSLLRGALPSAEEIAWLRRLQPGSLDGRRIRQQTRHFSTHSFLDPAVGDLIRLVAKPFAWRLLGWRLRIALLRAPANRLAFWKRWKQEHLRLVRKPVVVAVLGPPGAGKSALSKALARLLSGTPMDAAAVSLGSWGESRIGRSLLARLAPAEVSWERILMVLRGRHVQLNSPERRIVESRQPGIVPCTLHAARQAVRNALFFQVVGVAWALRYARRVARCRRPLVIADGWIYDLACKLGRTPLTQGERQRRRLYGWLPAPDGILYISTTYEIAGSRDRQLTREQFVGVERTLRKQLRAHGPLELVSDASPTEMARTFLKRYWAHLLERYNSG